MAAEPSGRYSSGTVSLTDWFVTPEKFEVTATLPLTVTIMPSRLRVSLDDEYGTLIVDVWVSETYLIRAFSHVFCAVRSTSMSGRR